MYTQSLSQTQPTPAQIAVLEAIYTLDERSGNETNVHINVCHSLVPRPRGRPGNEAMSAIPYCLLCSVLTTQNRHIPRPPMKRTISLAANDLLSQQLAQEILCVSRLGVHKGCLCIPDYTVHVKSP